MPRIQRNRLLEALERIADGQTRGLDIIPLSGRDVFRLRQGRYRAIYNFETGTLTLMVVIRVGHRKEVYR